KEDRRISYRIDTSIANEIPCQLYHVCYHLVYKYTPTSNPVLADEIPSAFIFEPVSGGITNRLFVAKLPTFPPLLVRLFGPHTDAVINRVSELQVAKYISRSGTGPLVYGSFLNGRLEGYIE